jgi:hypothetical protein
MNIPRFWTKASASARTPDGRSIPVSIWGWGSDAAGAAREASSRLARMLERIGRGEPLPKHYAYGNRPLKEEILETFEPDLSDAPVAMVTRNGYGAVVLNTTRLLFLDIDVPAVSAGRRMLHKLGIGADESHVPALEKVRDALRQYGRATFRAYRTASGLRLIAIDREFDPDGPEARELMEKSGTDPAFIRLCTVQHSFRARLTPKPWRCGVGPPPGEHPRDEEARRRFAAWLSEYEKKSGAYATCRYLETIGVGRPAGFAGKLIELHDRMTRSAETLPLA